MEKVLTVSIAAYNMEKYIREALDPLTDQRVIDDLEIFVIDDGGTDRTLEIAKEYAGKYPDSIFPIHKENGGYGTTVNYAVAHAAGKYFKLLDGDDWFDTQALVSLVETLKKTDADIVMTPFYRVVNGRKTKKEERGVEKDKLMQISEVADRISILAHWATTVRTEVLKCANIDLPGKMNYTDAIFMYKAYESARTIYYCDPCVYCYRVGREGQSSGMASRAKHYKEEMYVFFAIADLYESSKAEGHPNLSVFLRRGSYSYCNVCQDIMCLDSKAARAALKEFEKDARNRSEDLYAAAAVCGRRGLLLKMLRETKYAAFPLVRQAFNLRSRQFG